jgi:hydroxymethylpyrimidine pyrophosphatase-like HAD family hydrolase
VLKQAYTEEHNPSQIAAFGNGNNDAPLLKTVKAAGGLAVAVDNGEGCSVEALQSANRGHCERIRFAGRADVVQGDTP